MKIGSMKALHIVLGLALFCAGAQNGQAQVARYDKTQAVGKRSFNYLAEDAQAQKTHKNKDIRIVFSDRDHNKAYAGPYAQRVLSEQKLAAPFYVIGEKNGFYKVVAADQSLLGQPKGMFAPLFNKRNHFKDAKNSPFVGWIDKNSVLDFNHSFVSKDNNFPIRYRIGASNVARLSNIKTFFTLDSLNLYSDPFFLEKSKGKLVAGQIVYAYKYDASKQAVLVSDRPSLSDSTRTHSDGFLLTSQRWWGRTMSICWTHPILTSADTHLAQTCSLPLTVIGQTQLPTRRLLSTFRCQYGIERRV